MDDNNDRFRYDGPSPLSAGDDLSRMANEVAHLRDFLIGLTDSLVDVSQDRLQGLAHAEEVIQDLLAPHWEQCQHVLRGATEKELDETDTEWMGEKMPGFFSGHGPGGVITPEEFRALRARLRARKLRGPTNPATLITTGQANA